MRPIRLLLAVESSLAREALADQMQAEPDIEVVGQVDDTVDLLLAIGETQANAVIVSCPVCTGVPNCGESPDQPVPCMPLLLEYPDLIVVGLARKGDRMNVCRQTIRSTVVPRAEYRDLVDEIRRRCSVAP